MEVLCKDNEKRQALNAGAMHACSLLNLVVIPICKELNFGINISDTVNLDRYMRDIKTLHADYIETMKEGTSSNPALLAVLEKSAESLWSAAYQKHPISNPSVIETIPKGIFDVITIVGDDIHTFHARICYPAIEKACIIYAGADDISKRDELKDVCKVLNKCFNGNAHLFSGYIGIVEGRFTLRDNIKNYKPLIYGTQD
ncbi:MAG: hypothetical protein J5382_04620 [Bacteroidales bacterium]|nr:hypothetical protein [Bacteroidales bacterium]